MREFLPGRRVRAVQVKGSRNFRESSYNAKRRETARTETDSWILVRAFANSEDGNFYQVKLVPIAPLIFFFSAKFSGTVGTPPYRRLVSLSCISFRQKSLYKFYTRRFLDEIIECNLRDCTELTWQDLVPSVFILYSFTVNRSTGFFYKNLSWRRHVRCQEPDHNLYERLYRGS